MRILFFTLWALLLLIPQQLLHFSLFGIPLGIDFITILIIYIAFTLHFLEGLISILLVTYLAEIFSFLPHGYLALAFLILFSGIQILIDQIFTEAYVTKSLWVFPFSVLSQGLIELVFRSDLSGIGLWIGIFIQASINVLASFPLLMILDKSFELWGGTFSRQKAHLTGADFYQVKINQRKYF